MSADMRKRFHELGRKKAAIEEANRPLQARYDELRRQQNDIDALLRPVAEQLRAAKMPLFDIDNERAMIARALGGQTGKPE